MKSLLKVMIPVTAAVVVVTGAEAGPYEDAPNRGHRISLNYRRWHALAEQGHAPSQYNIGVLYREGIAVDQSYSEAASWYRRAAAQDHAKAENGLGFLYQTGKGVPQDMVEAAKWYRKSAEQGLAAAQFNLGLLYDNGTGVPRNTVQAYVWFNAAATSGHAKANRLRQAVSKKMSPAELVEAQQQTVTVNKKTVAIKPPQETTTDIEPVAPRTVTTGTLSPAPAQPQTKAKERPSSERPRTIFGNFFSRKNKKQKDKVRKRKKRTQSAPATWERRSNFNRQ